MKRHFNIEGSCHPTEHYMINLDERLKVIKELVDNGKYFSITKARQYGKTTTLDALATFLSKEYMIISLDFQMLGHEDFKNESSFVSAFSREVLMNVSDTEAIPSEISEKLSVFSETYDSSGKLSLLFVLLSKWCKISKKPIVLIIDEVDSATNNQVFLDFLAQLRGYYLHRKKRPTFHSVILAGVYDVKNLRQKIRPDEEHKRNSPWNIATKFNVDMSFSASSISNMLMEYEQDYHTGMDVEQMAELIYDYTSGYPFLVSDLCRTLDEEIAGSERFPKCGDAWTKAGFLEAVKVVLAENNTLFESLVTKLQQYPELEKMLYHILFHGRSYSYNILNETIEIAEMFGFIKNKNGIVTIANRIFETVLYNLFLTSDEMKQTGERNPMW